MDILPQRGRFITLEGIEGAGKSTLIPIIARHLQSYGKSVLTTREPGGTPLAEAIRHLLLTHTDEPFEAKTELLLIFAARNQHLSQIIQPALHSGTWVLCDRFTATTYAYQGGGRGLPDRYIKTLEGWIQGSLRPDLSFILDVPVALGLERARQSKGRDRIESTQIDFFERARATYLALAADHPKYYRVIDAYPSTDQIAKQLCDVLDHWLLDKPETNTVPDPVEPTHK